MRRNHNAEPFAEKYTQSVAEGARLAVVVCSRTEWVGAIADE